MTQAEIRNAAKKTRKLLNGASATISMLYSEKERRIKKIEADFNKRVGPVYKQKEKLKRELSSMQLSCRAPEHFLTLQLGKPCPDCGHQEISVRDGNEAHP